MEKVKVIESEPGAESSNVFTNFLLSYIQRNMFNMRMSLFSCVQAYRNLKDYTAGKEYSGIESEIDLLRMLPSPFQVGFVSPVFPFLYHSILYNISHMLLRLSFYDDALEFSLEGLDTSEGNINSKFKEIVDRILESRKQRVMREESSKIAGFKVGEDYELGLKRDLGLFQDAKKSHGSGF